MTILQGTCYTPVCGPNAAAATANDAGYCETLPSASALAMTITCNATAGVCAMATCNVPTSPATSDCFSGYCAPSGTGSPTGNCAACVIGTDTVTAVGCVSSW